MSAALPCQKQSRFGMPSITGCALVVAVLECNVSRSPLKTQGRAGGPVLLRFFPPLFFSTAAAALPCKLTPSTLLFFCAAQNMPLDTIYWIPNTCHTTMVKFFSPTLAFFLTIFQGSCGTLIMFRLFGGGGSLLLIYKGVYILLCTSQAFPTMQKPHPDL